MSLTRDETKQIHRISNQIVHTANITLAAAADRRGLRDGNRSGDVPIFESQGADETQLWRSALIGFFHMQDLVSFHVRKFLHRSARPCDLNAGNAGVCA